MSHLSSRNTLNRIPELDGLRGIAILSVLIYHFFWFPSPGWDWNGIAYALWRVAQIGWIGVHIFFVLSGFLITRILVAQKNEPGYYAQFYKRRILRIFPLYLITLVFTYFYFPDSGKFVVLSLLFLAHAAPLFHIQPSYPVLWSLSIEEQFYFAWPWLVRRLTARNLLVLCGLIIGIEPGLRGLAFVMKEKMAWLILLNSFDGFAVGALLALGLYTHWKKWVTLGVVLTIGLLPWGVYTRTTLLGEMFLPTLLYLFMAGLMAFCIVKSGTPALRGLRHGFLPQWGKISYGAYLSHHAVFEGVDWVFRKFALDPKVFESLSGSYLRAGILLAATYGVSYLLFHWIEKPFLQTKDAQNPNVLETQSVPNSALKNSLN